MIVTGASFYCRIIKIRRSFLLLKKTIYIPGQYIIQDQTQNYRSRKAEWMKEEHKSERDDKVDGPFQRSLKIILKKPLYSGTVKNTRPDTNPQAERKKIGRLVS